MFKRKAYDKLLEWKTQDNGKYAILLEGPRRVGKTTIVKEFASNEYQSNIFIDFAIASPSVIEAFDYIHDLDRFFLLLQAIFGVNLIDRKSVIVFDEVQKFPKARQAIKYLVADGRYDYIETGSLISIKQNTKDIIIPSEEKRISLYPMDYEEFKWACNNTTDTLRKICQLKLPVGESTSARLMDDFRIYMAVGGMPQAVEAYLEKKNFAQIDEVKRNIINLYKDDFYKIDKSGRISKIFESIPAQLSSNKKRFSVSSAINKKKSYKDEELLSELIDSKTVIPCYNITDPSITLQQTKNLDMYKLYLADIGLFTTMLFNSGDLKYKDLYAKLLKGQLSANLGFMYENCMAQIIKSSGFDLYYHTWRKTDSTHSCDIDFIVTHRMKIIPIEVKSSSARNHKSLDAFNLKYAKKIAKSVLFSQSDYRLIDNISFLPFYLAPFFFDEL